MDPQSHHHQFRHSSTLLSKTSKLPISTNTSTSSAGNRTLSSCVGSYVRVPAYDHHILIQNNTSLQQQTNPEKTTTSTFLARESIDSGISRASFKQLTPTECLRAYLEQQQNQQPNYYETLSTNNKQQYQQQHQQQQHQQNYTEYHVYNPLEPAKFDSLVVMPVVMPTLAPNSNSTVVFLASGNGGFPLRDHKSQYSSLLYGDIGTSSGSSTSSNGSNQPLLSFGAAGSASTNTSTASPI